MFTGFGGPFDALSQRHTHVRRYYISSYCWRSTGVTIPCLPVDSGQCYHYTSRPQTIRSFHDCGASTGIRTRPARLGRPAATGYTIDAQNSGNSSVNYVGDNISHNRPRVGLRSWNRTNLAGSQNRCPATRPYTDTVGKISHKDLPL